MRHRPGVTLVEVSDGSSRVQSEADVKAELFEQAGVRGVKVDKNWSVQRMQKALADASSEVV